ncbi:MFS transporter [Terrilactibacillus sp. S3-3]|nr:MFS transporter [Terrilactibacillus sp. S3-3]
MSCYAMNSREQGRNIAINGIFVTLANMIAPLIGGRLVHFAGYQGTYFFIGAAMFFSTLVALLFIREENMVVSRSEERIQLFKMLIDGDLIVVYFAAFCLMFAEGTLFYEMPLQMLARGYSERSIGELFSFFSLGSLFVLSLLFINRLSPASRTLAGMLFFGFFVLPNDFFGGRMGNEDFNDDDRHGIRAADAGRHDACRRTDRALETRDGIWDTLRLFFTGKRRQPAFSRACSPRLVAVFYRFFVDYAVGACGGFLFIKHRKKRIVFKISVERGGKCSFDDSDGYNQRSFCRPVSPHIDSDNQASTHASQHFCSFHGMVNGYSSLCVFYEQ